LAKALPENGELVTCEISDDFAKVKWLCRFKKK
jgi:predicted O-methyltransferase YrrM